MSYIGVQPTAGQYRQLDDISGSFNGTAVTFTTSVGGLNVTAGSAEQLLVSLGGVIQNPGADYSVSTNSITFTTAPSSGLDFFAVLMGDAVNVGTPADGSVTSVKLASDLTVDLASGSASTPSLTFDANTGLFSPGADQVAASVGGTEAYRIDSSGRLLVGTSSARSPLTHSPLLQVEGLGYAASTASVIGNSNDTNGGYFFIGKSRGTSLGANTIVQSGDELGGLDFLGADGSQLLRAARITALVDGTPGANDMPGRLVFSTTADGASSPTERMRIPNGGGLSVGSSVNPNALTQTTGIRLGDNTIASHSFTNITTSPVTIANGVGVGGLGFIQAFNTSTGAQYTGIIMWRSGVVAVVSESNALGFGLTYSVSGSTLRLQTASGTISGSIITLAG